MEKDIDRILITEEEIRVRCKELGEQIAKDYKDKNVIMIGLLRGCIPFMADLARNMNIPMQVDYMDVSSYQGTESTGQIKVLKDLDTNIEGLDVIIAEDIIDTGQTLNTVINMFKLRKAKSIRVVTLLDKPEGRTVDFTADYVGFTIPKEFVVGYGLDYNEFYRNLPYVGVLKEEVYSK